MLRLYGVPITEDEGRRLIATLVTALDTDSLSAASMIRQGLDDALYTVALTIEQREAILDVLEDAESPGLAELRGVLLRDHERRQNG